MSRGATEVPFRVQQLPRARVRFSRQIACFRRAAQANCAASNLLVIGLKPMSPNTSSGSTIGETRGIVAAKIQHSHHSTKQAFATLNRFGAISKR